MSKTPAVIMLMLLTLKLSSSSATLDRQQVGYEDFLRTETSLIGTLRDYLEGFEKQLTLLKEKTSEIQGVHDEALNNVDKYVSNPLNAVTILKRFATDWNALHKMAKDILNNTEEATKDVSAVKANLSFPNEDDLDEAVGNLLRLQDIYGLEPKRLSLGEMNGVKFGPEMSWSDCLEIARKSEQNGEFAIAKFWIETAMGKLPPAEGKTNKTEESEKEKISFADSNEKQELIKARFEILQVSLNAEYYLGNFEAALNIANEMLLLKPQNKGVLKAKKTIEKTLKKESKRAKSKREKKTKQLEEKIKNKAKKSVEAALIEELCRSSTMAPFRTNSVSSANKCLFENAGMPELLLQPIKVEILSLDPYIVIHHDVLNGKQIDTLKNLIHEVNPSTSSYLDSNPDADADGQDDDDDDEAYSDAVSYDFTNLAKQKLRRINDILQLYTGHSSNLFNTWQPEQHAFEPDISSSLSSLDWIDSGMLASMPTLKQKQIEANLRLTLQTAKVGGSIVFPQLELSIYVPNGALLYASNLNEFLDVDYRVKFHICPVVSGSQISASTTIRRA